MCGRTNCIGLSASTAGKTKHVIAPGLTGLGKATAIGMDFGAYPCPGRKSLVSKYVTILSGAPSDNTGLGLSASSAAISDRGGFAVGRALFA